MTFTHFMDFLIYPMQTCSTFMLHVHYLFNVQIFTFKFFKPPMFLFTQVRWGQACWPSPLRCLSTKFHSRWEAVMEGNHKSHLVAASLIWISTSTIFGTSKVFILGLSPRGTEVSYKFLSSLVTGNRSVTWLRIKRASQRVCWAKGWGGVHHSV